jgi:mRNA interferase RelE/StbE
MNVQLSQAAVEGLSDAPLPVQKAFIKQINYLVRNLNHPSLRAKKFDEARGRWQPRVNDDWRFYFTIERDTYRISEAVPHPK